MLLVLLIGCDKGSTKPQPAPSPTPPAPLADAAVDAGNACEKQIAEIEQSVSAFEKAMLGEGLETFPPRWLPTPFARARGGARPPAEVEEQRRRGAMAFENKHNGDRVQWNDSKRTWAGIYFDPKPGWTIARRGNRVFAVTVKSIRTITCVDPSSYTGTCDTGARSPWLLALPEGTTFGGTITLDVEQLRLERTGGPPIECPPPRATAP
ncbi:MAG TPA: hypothetical protein VLB44_08285 [Kofleriaceae bacterium]|nr:hypothetical protein [Kofleriaceae bacterium]